ncbi:MAG: hypothetical protein IPK50_04430 [Fibrobacterota bacterium]|nr:hypothetical protein [Fibrobacterota bacterium]QQS06142.1 MAG: hypothetical protein IPK50_04430 [Fibrobacterota bacterium]
MSTDPNMSYDPDEGRMSTMPPPASSGSEWFPPEGGMCTPENPEGNASFPEQNMSYNTPDGKPPVASVWGYTSSFFGDGGMCSVDPGANQSSMSYGGMCVDNGMSPHLEGGMSSGKFLQVLLSGPGGYVEGDVVEINEEQFATVEWWALGAEYVLINGDAVEPIGRFGAPYENDLASTEGKVRFYEVAASFPGGAKERRQVGVKMVGLTTGGAQEVKFEISADWLNECLTKAAKRISAGTRYVELDEVKFAIEVSGKVGKSATWSGAVSHAFSKDSVQQGLSGAVTKSLKLDSEWTMDVSGKASAARGLKFEDGVSFTAEAKVGCEIVFQKKVGDATWAFSLEVTLGLYEFSWKFGGELKSEWPLTVEIAGGVAYGGPWNIMEFAFDGSVKGTLSAKVRPNWKMIAADVAKSFAPELLSLGALAIPLAIVVGGVATIAVNVTALMAVWELKDTRDSIKRVTDETTRGYMDGLRGFASSKEAPKIEDAANAYNAGVAAGSNRREEVIRDHCGGEKIYFSDWLMDNSDKVREEVWSQTRTRLVTAAWNRIGPNHSGTATMVLQEQKWDWIYIVGNNPQSLGESWVKLWKDVRREDPDNPRLSDGFW